jgi:hypothetical protein
MPEPPFLSPIAIRGFAHPPEWAPKPRRRPKGGWPRCAFLLATVTRPEPGEPLRFGVCALLPSLLAGQRPLDVRLFYPDDCPADELGLLAQVAAANGLAPPVGQRELVLLMLRRSYSQRLALVGFGLPPLLGQLVGGWQLARGGGFSLIPVTRPCPPGKRKPEERRRRPILQNGEIENGNWPRIALDPLDGLRAHIRFRGRGRPYRQDLAPDGEGGRTREHYVFPGYPVDLATLASVQAGGKRFPTLAAASSFFGLPAPEHPPTPPGGEPDRDCVEALLAEADDLAVLYLHLLDCHRQTAGSERVSPNQVYSPGSYAEGLFEQAGLSPPLPDCGLPAYAHAQGMAAFFGGDCGIARRHQPRPAAYVDITGHHPVSAHLGGTFELLTADKLELADEDPAQLLEFLAALTPARLLAEPQPWRRLARTVCVIRPHGDLLPHRIPNGTTVLLKTAPLAGSEPVPYLLADLAVSFLRTGLLPEIVSAFSIQPGSGKRRFLRRVQLPSGRWFNARSDDLFLVLAEERLRLEQRADLTCEERERQAKVLKLIVNAACYGLLCQVNVQQGPGRIQITDLDGSSRTIERFDPVEEPGRWFHPLLAAGVTATGRLLLHLARRLLEQTGATISTWDTDSLTSSGLTPEQLAAAQTDFEQLSPYDPELQPGVPLLLALEPENFDPDTGERHDLYVHATASKNYDLYTQAPDGTVTLHKTSEHGLGHIRTPGRPELDDRHWIEEGRRYLLQRRLGIPTDRPCWWDEPKISVVTLNRPAELARQQQFQADGRNKKWLRPFSRLAVAHPTPVYSRGPDGNRRTPAAPFHTGFNPNSASWRDLTAGSPLTLHYPGADRLVESDLTTTIPGRILCDTVGQALERNSRRPETKALDQHGNPCGRHTAGPLQPAPTEAIRLIPIGKEARNLERAGITEDPKHTLYTDPELDAWRHTFLPALRRLDPGTLTRGRPSWLRRADLARRAGKLARAALQQLDPTRPPPDDPEQACHLYLQMAARRTCACGCGTPVAGRSRYAAPAHRTRAYRARTAMRLEATSMPVP